MSGIQGAAEAVRQPIALQAEWTISTKPMELALDAINTAAMYFAGSAHPIATGIGFFMTLPGHSYKSMRLQPEVCNTEEKIKNEVARRNDLLSSLAWKSCALAYIYFESQLPEDGFSLGSILAFYAGARFCNTLARNLVYPNAVYAKQEEKLPDISHVICTIRNEDGATVYEARS